MRMAAAPTATAWSYHLGVKCWQKPERTPNIFLADIDLGLSAETRAKIPSLKHGREFEVEIGGAKLPPKREAL